MTSARADGLEVRDTPGNTRTRDISESIAKAIEATVEALAHFHRRNSYAAFDEFVHRGVSYELLHSLAGLAEHSDGAAVSVEFDAGSERALPATAYSSTWTAAPRMTSLRTFSSNRRA